jgi:hypothetical protein
MWHAHHRDSLLSRVSPPRTDSECPSNIGWNSGLGQRRPACGSDAAFASAEGEPAAVVDYNDTSSSPPLHPPSNAMQEAGCRSPARLWLPLLLLLRYDGLAPLLAGALSSWMRWISLVVLRRLPEPGQLFLFLLLLLLILLLLLLLLLMLTDAAKSWNMANDDDDDDCVDPFWRQVERDAASCFGLLVAIPYLDIPCTACHVPSSWSVRFDLLMEPLVPCCRLLPGPSTSLEATRRRGLRQPRQAHAKSICVARPGRVVGTAYVRDRPLW